MAEGHYLLSYCSPKRKGEHELQIEISTEKDHGVLTHRYTADGFTKGCSASHAPSFAKKDADKPADDGDSNAGDEGEKTAAKSAPARGKPSVEKQAAADDVEAEEAPSPKATRAAASDDDVAPRPAKRGGTRKQQSKSDKEPSEE